MTHFRSNAAAALVAVLLASCAGVDDQRASRPADTPPQATQDIPTPAPVRTESALAATDTRATATPPAPADAAESIVVTSTRIQRQEYNSVTPSVTVTESNLNRLPAFAPAQTQAARRGAQAPVRASDSIGRPPYIYQGRDRFTSVEQNPFRVAADEPVSTFSIDVDTASYSFVRASLNRNALPQPDAVRTEEMVNYFPYDYEAPRSATRPFSTSVDVFPSPWTEGRKLVRVGIRGYDVARETRPRANLVFLIDTSGSMQGPGRLDLVKQSLAMLVEQLGANDRVAIVT
jgi:Ca-activated chloride channel family protein